MFREVLKSNDYIKIFIKGKEIFDEANNEFIEIEDTTLTLEHSLVSIRKWETKLHKPFLSKEEKTHDEIFYYIQCMTIEDVDPMVYSLLTNEDIDKIKKFIDDPMTATFFTEIEGKPKGGGSRQIITAELIYYSIIGLQIPIECEHWHINSLLTLIRVCNEKNSPEKKMSKNTILRNNAAINAARRKKFNSKG